jgi:hypothetical protein
MTMPAQPSRRGFRATAIAAGAAAFVAAHIVQLLTWRVLFEPGLEQAPWFLNSGRAVAFAAACLFLTSLVYSRLARRAETTWTADGLALTVGAVVAMTIVLAVRGPGTIFPIAWTVGALILSASCTAGSFIATKL